METFTAASPIALRVNLAAPICAEVRLRSPLDNSELQFMSVTVASVTLVSRIDLE